MDQESAESALLGVVREDNQHQHEQSSGSSLALEEGAELATFGAALQQLVLPTAGIRAESSDLPAERASVANSTTPVISRGIGPAPMDNRQRCINVVGPYELRCEVLDNRQGRMIIDGPLAIYCGQLNSDHGVITATGPITILCGGLDNHAGQISSHQGTISITSRHVLQNRRGKIAAQWGITLDNSQKTLNNSHGSISTPGQLQIHSGELENPGGALLAKDGITILLDTGSIRGAGKIHSGDELQISLQSEQATELHGVLQADSEAQITAQGVLKNHSQISGKAITVEGPGIENAAEGSICSQGHTQILTGASQEGYFNNRGGVDGATTEICSYHLNNLGGGTIEGDQLLLGAHSLINNSEQVSPDTKAIISARQHLILGAQHILNQEGALIRSAGTMKVGERLDEQQQLVGQTLELNNDSATIDVQGDAHFNVTTLNNHDIHFSTREAPVSESYHRQYKRARCSTTWIQFPTDNPGRSACRRLGNRNFFQEANDQDTLWEHTTYEFTRRVTETQITRCDPAKLLVGGNLNLNGTVLNNDKSQVIIGEALVGLLKNINNRDAYGTRVTTEDGSSESFTGHYQYPLQHRQECLSSGRAPYHSTHPPVTIPLNRVVNQHTALIEAAEIQFNLSGDLQNSGSIRARRQATVSTGTFNHDTGSTLWAGEQLTLESDTLNGEGTITSAGVLVVNLRSQQPVALRGVLQAGGKLMVTAPGEFNNHSQLQAGQQLTLRANFIRNHAEGVINAAHTRVLANEGSQGRLNNRGLIDGQITEVRAHSLNNLGSGVIYGDQLLLGAHTLTNNREQVNASTKAIIAARQQLTLGAQHILNREGALIMSAGPMAVGERLDEQQQLVGQTLELNNDSATLDVHGDANFNITTLNNRDLHFSTQETQVSESYHRHYRRDDYASHILWVQYPSANPGRSAYRRLGNLNFFQEPNDQDTLRQHTTYEFTRRVTETQITRRDPAKLLVGGNFNLNGTVLNNDKSQVIIGGALVGPLKNINNRDAYGTRITTENGTSESFKQAESLFSRHCCRSRSHAPYNTHQPQTIPLNVVVDQRNTRPAGSGVQIAERAELALPPSITAEGQLAPFTPLPSISEVTALARHPSTGLAMVIRSSHAPLVLPTSGLFNIDTTATDRPLISSDPRFINYHSGFTTQHLLRELCLTTTLPRRYGDSFYEQQRLRDQVIQLTGQRFLPGYQSDAQQQQALVTQGIAAAQALQLTPGKALTAAQQAQLTTAIVWPVVKPVTLANDQITQVLDLQLYIPLVAYSPANSGNALIAASTIQLDLSGDLCNSGNIRASNTLALTAENIHNQRGTLHGRANRLKARQDVHNQGGNLGAEQHLQVQAGRDVKLQTATVTSSTISHTPEGPSACYSHTALDQRAGVYVLQPQGVLEVAAERDVDITAARVLNAGVAGRTQFTAGRDITLGAVQVGEHQQITGHYHSINQGHSREVGSQLKTAGDIDFQAGRNFDSTAAQVTSGIQLDHPGAPRLTEASSRAIAAAGGSEESLVAADSTVDRSTLPPTATGSLRIRAGNHIDIRAGQASYYYQRQWGGSHQDTSENSVLKEESGLAVQAPQGELQVAAAQDLTLSAVQIGNTGAGGKTTLTAGRHLTLGTMNTTQQQSHIQSADNFLKQHRSAEVGAEIQTVGDLQCRAGEHFQATAAQVSSQEGALQVAAGAQLDIRSGYATRAYVASSRASLSSRPA